MSLLPEISQASAEINKLVAQANIHQTIAPVDPAAFTDPADTMLLAYRDPVIREVSVGMTGVEAALRTVSGIPPLSLPQSLGEPLTAWSVDVLPYQEGTGDPSPSNVRPIHGTDKLNLFVEESYDQSATPTAVLTLPQTVYTGTIGSEGGESRWGEVDLGTLDWIVNNEDAHIFVCNPPNIKSVAGDDYSGRNQNAICEAYKPSTSISISSSMDDLGWLRAGTQYFVRDTNYSDRFAFTASVSGVKLIYELENPVQFPLTTPTIPTPTGTATTWATAEDGTVESMEVTYVGKA